MKTEKECNDNMKILISQRAILHFNNTKLQSCAVLFLDVEIAKPLSMLTKMTESESSVMRTNRLPVNLREPHSR